VVGGVDDDDDDAEVLPCPSRKAALKAAAILERYITVLEEFYARKLENLLMFLATKHVLKRHKVHG
jgi:hypothetical protein